MNPQDKIFPDSPEFVKRSTLATGAEYTVLVKSLISRYKKSQIKAAVRVNTALLEFYWELGRDIVRLKAESKWGAAFFDSLSLDLKNAFPGDAGFSVTNLRFTKRWYEFYNQQNKIRYQLGNELEEPVNQGDVGLDMPINFGLVPWRHHVHIFRHAKSVAEALFYIDQTIKEQWSRHDLECAMAQNLFQASNGVVNNFESQLPVPQSGLAKSILKSPYNLSFLEPDSDRSERKLEDELAKNISRFLLELGQGFAYVGRQMELRMPSGNTFVPDMIFYHTRLKSYIVLELKITEYKPDYVGKLNFYVSAVDELMKQEDDNPTIGLLICKSKDDTIVEWSFRGLNRPLGVASYELDKKLSQLLPSEHELQKLFNDVDSEISE